MQVLKTIIFIVLLCAIHAANAQIIFEKTYGNSQEERGEGLVQLSDSSYVIVGSTSSFGDLSTNLLLLKTDSLGNPIWTKIFGGNNVDAGMEIIKTSDGNLAMVGYTNSTGAGGYDVYFIKTDVHGTVLLSKSYGGADWDLGYSLAETSDGGFVLTGETYSSGAGSNDLFVLKIDASGDSVWSKEFGGIGNEIGWSIDEASNGDLIVAGETSSTGAGESDAWLIRMDNVGNIIWEVTFGDTESDVGKDLTELSNGNIMFVWNTILPGNTYWSTIQSKIDPNNGNEMRNTAFTNPYNYFSYKVIPYAGRSTTLTVGYYAFSGSDDMMFFGVDTVNMYYDAVCQGLGLGALGPDYGKDIIVTSDGGVALDGERNIGTGYSSVFFVKLMEDCIGTGSTLHDSIFVTAVEEQHLATDRIYPNPSCGEIHFQSENPVQRVLIYNTFGALLEEHLNPIQNEIQTNLPTGMYILCYENGIEEKRSKLIIHR